MTVNQRVLGSSPRGGAKAKPNTKVLGFFVFITFGYVFHIHTLLKAAGVLVRLNMLKI